MMLKSSIIDGVVSKWLAGRRGYTEKIRAGAVSKRELEPPRWILFIRKKIDSPKVTIAVVYDIDISLRVGDKAVKRFMIYSDRKTSWGASEFPCAFGNVEGMVRGTRSLNEREQ